MSCLVHARRIAANSDLGPILSPVGTHPSDPLATGTFSSDLTIGQELDGHEIFDSSLPAGAPAGSYSTWTLSARGSQANSPPAPSRR